MAAKNLTQLLQRWNDGDQTAADELFSIVYNELRGLARGVIRYERNNLTLQPTALVHEAYLRLIDQGERAWPSRSHFYAFAAKIMRHVLVDQARKRLAHKRGGEFERVSLSLADPFNDQKPIKAGRCLHWLVGIPARIKKQGSLSCQNNDVIRGVVPVAQSAKLRLIV